MNDVDSLQTWIDHVFDHPVAEPSWYRSPDHNNDDWHDSRPATIVHIAETLEQSGELLARFSDAQLDQGFWYLFCHHPPDFMGTLLDDGIPLAMRLRALKSFVPLFEQVMAVRCSSHFGCPDEDGVSALNSACYMWFDELLDRFHPQRLRQAQLETELIATLGTILDVPHDACRESALHGIGHWVTHYPELADVVDRFLSGNPSLRPELVAYAKYARAGQVL
jgi:hypothetical protein